MKVVAQNWKKMSADEKKKYEAMAQEDKKRYETEMQEFNRTGYFTLAKTGVHSSKMVRKVVKPAPKSNSASPSKASSSVEKHLQPKRARGIFQFFVAEKTQ
jgi:hypothetical protein